MRGLPPFALLSICTLAPAGTSAAPTAPPPQHADGAAIVRGSARARPDGAHDWRDVNPGDVLGSGVSVEAAPGEPLEMLLPDGVSVTLESGGAARWMTPGKLPTETNRFTRGYHLVLVEGELDVRMPPGPKGSHAFLVSTKAGTLTDWRGKLHVSSHEDTTAAAIYEGALVVGSNGQGFPVYDGAGILMRKGVDPDKSRVIPSAPKWDGASGGLPSFAAVPSGSPATLGFSWAAVAGATSYRVAVATDAAMTHVVQRASTAETTFGLVQGATGDRGEPSWAQVRAVGSEGIVGEWSAPRPLRVVRYALPPGAFVARDGAVVMPRGSVVTLSDPAGVDVAFENVRSLAGRVSGVPLYWSHVTGPIRLPDDTPLRIVHLRDSSSAPAGGSGNANASANATESATQLVLARRELRADIDLTPKSPHPGDAVDARVVVWDPSGRIDPTAERITLEALLDLDPVAVAWQRAASRPGADAVSGSGWVARIQTRRTDRPSVVRVVARDSAGAEIGRGFLEVAAGR